MIKTQRLFFSIIILGFSLVIQDGVLAAPIFSDFSFGTGTPFTGSTTLGGVGVTLVTTNTEPFSSTAFRNTNSAIVTFTFSGPITEFYLDVSRVRAGERLTGFNIGPPLTQSGSLINNVGDITTSASDDFGQGRLSWLGINTTTVSFTIDTFPNSTLSGVLAVDQFGINTDINLCCPPWTKNKLSAAFKVSPAPGGLFSNYTLSYQSSPSTDSQMSTYVTYLKSVFPSVTSIDVVFTLEHYGNTNLPITNIGLVNVPQNPITLSWTGNSPSSPSFWSGFTLKVNEWYKVSSKLEVITSNGQKLDLFEEECNEAGLFYRIQFLNARSSTGIAPTLMLQVSDGKTIIKSIPVNFSQLPKPE